MKLCHTKVLSPFLIPEKTSFCFESKVDWILIKFIKLAPKPVLNFYRFVWSKIHDALRVSDPDKSGRSLKLTVSCGIVSWALSMDTHLFQENVPKTCKTKFVGTCLSFPLRHFSVSRRFLCGFSSLIQPAEIWQFPSINPFDGIHSGKICCLHMS